MKIDKKIKKAQYLSEYYNMHEGYGAGMCYDKADKIDSLIRFAKFYVDIDRRKAHRLLDKALRI